MSVAPVKSPEVYARDGPYYLTTFDRLLGTRFGAAAIRLIADGGVGRMVCLRPPTIDSVSLEEVATGKPRTVPLDSDTILSARQMGISFGDRVE